MIKVHTDGIKADSTISTRSRNFDAINIFLSLANRFLLTQPPALYHYFFVEEVMFLRVSLLNFTLFLRIFVRHYFSVPQSTPPRIRTGTPIKAMAFETIVAAVTPEGLVACCPDI